MPAGSNTQHRSICNLIRRIDNPEIWFTKNALSYIILGVQWRFDAAVAQEILIQMDGNDLFLVDGNDAMA
ncbi:hypothetical protein BM1_10122 [Bipolaris maydis]|nr:hypothetical protein BM1_10122 [Bipolaris maydis]